MNTIKIKWNLIIRQLIKETGRSETRKLIQSLIEVLPTDLKQDLVEAFEEHFQQ